MWEIKSSRNTPKGQEHFFPGFPRNDKFFVSPNKEKESSMNIVRYFLVWLLSFAFTSLIDAVWHLGIFKRAYSEGIKPLARMSGDKMTFNAFAGILSQVLVVTCIVFLVLFKTQKVNYLEAALIGAAAGILAITVYGVTNYALFKDWSLKLTVLEVIWGPMLGASSGAFVVWTKSLLI
jgi:uncharacterized membrane protein